ncbi:MAG: hypothetical protein KAG61_11080 [Bacteriovoracaceae bacterium]|nr:hypothetical protein [Bacteriovoracaceae bacterium]
MGKLADIIVIQKLGKITEKSIAEDYYANINLNFESAEKGISKIKQIMVKYKLSFSAAYDCAVDPAQLQMLKTMNPK